MQCANVILMPVRQHNAEQLVLDAADSAKVRDNNVHAKVGVVRKHEAAINHHHAAGGFPQLTVEADLSQPPEGGNVQIRFIHS